MAQIEEVELTNMCMLCDGKGRVLVQNKVGDPHWHGWTFPGGHVEKGEYVTPSVIREVQEETGLTIQHPRLCGIKEFHKQRSGRRYIVFLYVADSYTGELQPSGEGEVFWYPLDKLAQSDQLIDGFQDMLPVFMDEHITELFYEGMGDEYATVHC